MDTDPMQEIIIRNPCGFIYCTTNNIDGKKYIGQRRYSYGWKSYLGSGTYLMRVIKKHGKENFTRIIIAFGYSQKELDDLEAQYIKLHNAVESDEFYNIASGGKNGNPFLGKTCEEMAEIRRKLRDNHADVNSEKNGKSIKILCVTTNEIFDCARDAERKYGVDHSSISKCCRNKRMSMGRCPNTHEKLVWQYYKTAEMS
jgi:hypothetical protein